MNVITIENSDGIAFINKTGYSMLYTIQAQVGINFDDVKIYVTDTQVTVTLPEPQILNRHADGSTLQFFDEKWALFKSNSMNDVPSAVKLAEEDFDKQTDRIQTYLDSAQQRAELAVRSLLEGVIEDKALIIK